MSSSDTLAFLAATLPLNSLHLVVARQGRKVWLVGHSSGPSYIQYFLDKGDPVVIENLVAGVASFNGNLYGEIDCLENLWHGGTFGDHWDAEAYRKTQSTWGITSWCLPQPSAYSTQVLVTTTTTTTTAGAGNTRTASLRRGEEGAVLPIATPPPSSFPSPSSIYSAFSNSSSSLPSSLRYFTAADIPELIALAGLATTMLPVYNSVANLTASPIKPLPRGVRGLCFYGESIPTPVKYAFHTSGILDSDPVVTRTMRGDGQQDDVTNTACEKWGANVVVQAFRGADHDTLLANPNALAALVHALRL